MSQISISTLQQCSDGQQLLRLAGKISRRENRWLTGLGVLQTAATIAITALFALLINNAVYSQASPAPWQQSAWLALAALLILRALLPLWQTRLADKASINVRNQLRAVVLEHCADLQLNLEQHFSSAELSNLLSSEIDSTRDYFAEFLPQQRLAMLTPLLIMLACLWSGWLVPLLLALSAPLVPLFMIIVGHKAAEASRRNLTELTRLGNLLSDRIKGISALQLANRCDEEQQSLFKQSEKFRHSTMQVLRLAFLSGTLLEFFSAISIAMVAVYLGLLYLDKYQIGMWQDTLTLSHGIFLLMLAPEFYLPLRRLGALYHARADASSVADHLLKLLQLQPISATEAKQTPAENIDQISLQQLQTGYGDTAIGKPLSCNLKRGQITLLTGPSGVGKSTLLDTLAGLHPAISGQVEVNQTAINIFNNRHWQQRIGYMTQQPELLFDSIRHNLCLGREFSDEQLYDALKQARAAQLVDALPEQLDYCVSDSGGFLSGGQAQRIALARVFLHQPDLLLLDEPTANLDQENAQAFMAGLQQFAANGGIVLISSHRDAQTQFDQVINLSADQSAEISHA
ncbi:thiol reductant ABC exporter subunit CydD [Amphritea sp. 2_MG-2023]|uniref:thiol reductant ABC exporter subunit CydD n=1 Tax=Amphritea TaxID=515417 RepID=UPI001C07E556|nr:MULTISPECIES: thiol reductant ABC exporter subunit CydD [Amphritea]MBU2966233.1 thiol reductant ABC exporter subunit CydD [Amphritea atlantica]MDO6417077.1 thiol reductant ABC exporter subunit CydD [Amphritea sp. 2_MG-2023]